MFLGAAHSVENPLSTMSTYARTCTFEAACRISIIFLIRDVKGFSLPPPKKHVASALVRTATGYGPTPVSSGRSKRFLPAVIGRPRIDGSLL